MVLFEVPEEEIWVTQMFSGLTAELNEFMVDALTTKRETIRNARFVSAGDRMVVLYEEKIEGKSNVG